MLRLSFIAFVVFAGAAAVAAAEPFEPFLAKHCTRCHGPDKVERDLRIDQLSRDFESGADGHLWAEIVERINAGEMPPEDETQPTENHAILLEDGPSLCLREGKAWKLKQVDINLSEGQLIASLDRKEEGEGLDGEHKLTIDGSTRIWRGRELLGLDELVSEGSWPAKGQQDYEDQPIQLALTWHPRYLYQQFHVADLWLDEGAMKVATERQRQRHIRHIRTRWMPAKVDSIKYGEFGRATIAATLFGGMDESLYADFKPGIGGKMASAEDTLRTWWPDHDGMDGRITAVDKAEAEPPLGSSGIQMQFEVPLILEGFRPGRTVRIRPQNWPNVKPPVEEMVRDLQDRWPSPDLFQK